MALTITYDYWIVSKTTEIFYSREPWYQTVMSDLKC